MKTLHVTIVEDDPNYTGLLVEAIERSPRMESVIRVHRTLEEALADDATFQHGVALVDLNLPDSNGLTTLRRFRERFTDVPVVVLTGVTDDALAVESIQAGAQDHWVKTDISLKHLPQLLIYAVERFDLQRQLDETRQSERQLREAMALERMGSDAPTPVSSALFAPQPLADSAPERLAEFKTAYAKMINDAVEERTFKTDLEVRRRLADLAGELGGYGAGPRDVIQVHTAGMRAALDKNRSTPTTAQMDEGRMLLVRLMGELVAYYRRLAGGLWRAATPGRRLGGA
jgi:DNA-binding NarL/FixJ family response regulator